MSTRSQVGSPRAAPPRPPLPLACRASVSRIAPHRIALGAIVVLAAVLRFATLGTQSIWFDEAATWDLMRLPFGELLHQVSRHESNPPLFYVLEWLWTHVFGSREAGLRSLSALAGTLTVPVAFGIGRRLAGVRAGLATAALVAVSPLLVWFSQEARSYALVVLLSAASLLLLLRCREDERSRALAAWAVVSALALATHYFAVFVLAPQAAWLLWRHPRRRAALAAVGALVAVGAALLPLLHAQRGNPYDIAGESLGLRLAQVGKQFLLGYRGPLPLASGIVGGLLVAGAAWLLLGRTERNARERAFAVAALAALGLALPLAAALAGADYLNARNAIPALVPCAAVLGVAFGASRPRLPGLALLGALCALSLAIVVAVAADRRYQRPDWKGLARALGHAAEPRAIVISPGNGDPPLRFYLAGLRTMAPAGLAVREVDVVAVAGSTSPGAAPRLPAQVGTALGLSGFGTPRRTATASYELLRFRVPGPVPVTPNSLAIVRFSQASPSVDVLPAGR
jgi:mannosyltransferase